MTHFFILCFSNRWPGLHPSGSSSCSSDSSSPAPGRGHQVSASQSEPVRPAAPRFQLQPHPRGPPGSLRLRQELQRFLRLLSPLCWQHTEWPLQDSSPWVHSIQICWHQCCHLWDLILTVHSVFPACAAFPCLSFFIKYCYIFVNPNGTFTNT